MDRYWPGDLQTGPALSLREMFSAERGAADPLLECERALLDPEVRRSREQVEALLHVDFSETGSSGEVYDGETMIEMMVPGSSGQVVARNFDTTYLTPDVALVTYRSVGTGGQEARRSSNWVYSDDRWQLRHHQGIRVPDRWGRVS